MTSEMMEEKVQEIIESMRPEDAVEVWNRYCEDCSYYDDRIEDMDFLSELVYGWDPVKIIETFCDGSFSTCDDWFWFDGCGNPVSSDDPFDQICLNDLVRYIVSYEEDYGIPEIREILEETEEDEETEEAEEGEESEE